MSLARFKLVALVAALAFCVSAPPASAQGAFGAIALSTKTGAWGTAYNYNNETAARNRALSECSQHADDCRVYRTFENVCVAVAGDGSGNFGWAWGFTPNERRRRAIQQCTDQGGQNCKIETQFCTGEAS